MRGYSVVAPQFWIGETGKALKKRGHEAVIVGLYLMTSPHANMLGMYYMPELYMAHETGLGIEGASKGLKGCIEAGFCSYDHDSEVVWVFEMARFQVGDELDAKDKRSKGVQNQYDDVPANPYLAEFFAKYGAPFCMTRKRESSKSDQAPSKPLGSQEQDQDQDQGQKQEQEQHQGQMFPPPPAEEPGAKKTKAVATTKKADSQDEGKSKVQPTGETWDAYAAAYAHRYGADPVRNATVNGQLANFVKRLGVEEAPHVAAFFVSHNRRYYVEQGHSVATMIRDAEKLRTEWVTRRQVTATEATQADRTQSNMNAFGPMLEAAREREAQEGAWNGE